MYDMASVKNPKLNIMPTTIPSGFCLPPVADDDKIIGKSGQIHGAKIVIRPETKENPNNIIIKKTGGQLLFSKLR